MKLLKKYFSIQNQIYNYFGYVEDWVVIPLDDSTQYYWFISGSESDGEVIFANKMEDFHNGNYYSNEIYTQRFLEKWVYRSDDYTMICTDTHTDGNKFLQIFDNKREITNPFE